MPKRVSLKGKGADLFFGDYPPPSGEIGQDREADRDTAAPPSSVEPAGLQPSMQATKHACVPAAAPDTDQPQIGSDAPAETQTRTRTTGPHTKTRTDTAQITVEGMLEAIWGDVSQPAPITGSFRYTDRELSALTDAVYELSKQHGVKFSKQEVVRLALNAVLWDYQSHGDGSLLASFVRRKKRQRGG